MNDNKNRSSKLDGLFENARNQEPVMNLNEVGNLLKNPSGFQKKKESNSYFWFGTFLLVGLVAFSSFYFYQGNSSTEEKSDNAFTVTTVTPSNSNTKQTSVPPADSPNQLSATIDNSDKNVSSENLSGENKGVKNSAAPEKPGKAILSDVKPEPKRETMNTYYQGNATISFLSDDNRKIKMIITPSDEVESLKINDEVISSDKYSGHKNIIDEGIKLKKANSKEDNSGKIASSEKQNIMNAMMKELTADGLISSNEPFDFTLTGQEAILNNKTQSQETFEKFKQVYEKITGEKLPAKYNLHIKR